MSHLLTVPAPRVIARPRVDAQGQHVLDESGKIIVDVEQVVDALLGYDLALQSVTSGPKLFECWSLRKRIKEAKAEHAFDSAKYILLDDAEKEILVQGFKTLDWTFASKHTFWVEWEALFDSISGIAAYDEKNPPAAYVSWKQAYEAKAAEAKAALAEIERKALELEQAAKDARAARLKVLVDARLQVALLDRIAEGKLGACATIEDLPHGVVAAIQAEAEAEADIDSKQTTAE